MTHRGGCHCGKIAYDFEGEAGLVTDCDRSLCQKRGGLARLVPASAFALKTPQQDDLGNYRFNRHAIDHHLFASCGVQSFCEGADAQGKKMAVINMLCWVDGIDPRQLEIKFHSGRDQ
jgi:hypothetical protein